MALSIRSVWLTINILLTDLLTYLKRSKQGHGRVRPRSRSRPKPDAVRPRPRPKENCEAGA